MDERKPNFLQVRKEAGPDKGLFVALVQTNGTGVKKILAPGLGELTPEEYFQSEFQEGKLLAIYRNGKSCAFQLNTGLIESGTITFQRSVPGYTEEMGPVYYSEVFGIGNNGRSFHLDKDGGCSYFEIEGKTKKDENFKAYVFYTS